MPVRTIERTAQTTTELVAAARTGDSRAWEELLSRYGGLIRGVVAAYRLSDADAADAAQNTWLRAVERLHTLRDPERLGGWLATTARRECLALLRRSRREVPDELLGTELVAVGPGPEAVALGGEARRAVGTAVAELTGRHRQLAHALFYAPDRGYTEVSRATGMPVGSIGPTRGRLLRNLRCALDQAGFGPDTAVA